MSKGPAALADVTDVDCTGTQALVTGSTSGIGRETALALAGLGADVIVHGRDEAAGERLVKQLSEMGSDSSFIQADFSDIDAVRALATTVKDETNELDLLINNAGGLFRTGQLTDIGVEYTFHVNHLGPYLLTTEFLDHLTDSARVVTTASHAHKGPSLDLDRVIDVEQYSGMWAYSHSKLANILFASELARRLDAVGRDITSNSVHPGAIPGSGFTRFLPGPVSQVVGLLDRVPGITSVADGAAELLFLAVSPRVATTSGRYFADKQPTTPSSAARDQAAARRLWRRSAELLGIDEPLADATAD